jgi:phosphatidate cytidylyltransferase
MLWAAWLALAQGRGLGLNFLLSVFCLVWVADISAYFGGRSFGRRKLAPRISPGKSWEGVWSGMAGVLLLAVLWLTAETQWAADNPSLFGLLWARLGGLGAAVALVVLAGMSVVGDLFESLVKRAAGAKDSSGLLPGHGGVLDRIDALLPVFPIALAWASL